MKLNELVASPGATQVAKRKGRGPGSGNGKTAGRGHKGQWARSGGGVRIGFEGGQMPLQRRIPKRGFTNIFRKDIISFNVSALNVFDNGAVVGVEELLEKRIINKTGDGIKVLGNGDIQKKITLKVNFFTESAKEKLEAAGGTLEVV